MQKIIIAFSILFVLTGCQFQDELEPNADIVSLLDKAHDKQDSPQQAIRHLNDAISLSHQIENTRYLCEAFNLSGFIYSREGEYVKAIESFESAISVNNYNPTQLAYSFYHLGKVYILIEDFEKAVYYYDKAAAEYGKLQSAGQYQKSIYSLALSTMLYGNTAEAMPIAKKALELAEVEGKPKSILMAVSLLAKAHIKLGDLSTAEKLIEEAEVRFGTFDNNTKLRFLIKKAHLQLENDEASKVAGLYTEAYQIMQDDATTDRSLVYKVCLDYGQFLKSEGKNLRATEIWESALSHPNASPGIYDVELSAIYTVLAETQEVLGNKEVAIRYYKKDLAINKAQKDLLISASLQFKETKRKIAQQEAQLEQAQEATTQAYLYGLYVVLGILLLGFGAWLYLRKRIKGYKHEIARQESRYIRKLRYVLQIYQTLRAIGGKGVAWVDDEDLQIIEDYIRENEHKVIQY